LEYQRITVVIHGDAVHFFAKKHIAKNKEIIKRFSGLTHLEGVSLSVCKLRAKKLGYKPNDLIGIVNIVPNGDAEIIHLQQQGRHYITQ
jgi:uncharacterized protein